MLQEPVNPTPVPGQSALRRRIELIIFGTGTLAGRRFDIALLGLILLSVAIVIADSVPELNQTFGERFWLIELCFTLLFTVEYGVRIWCTHNRRAYITSFWGLIDLLAILPTYIAIGYPAAEPLVVVRLLRVLRVFRVFRLIALFSELNEILAVLRSTARSIFVFLIMVLLVMVVFASVIYVIEGPASGFVSLPVSIYWAVVTITTVGYGDLVPQTPAGRFIAGAGMLVGYSIIAVPTAIITRKLWERINERDTNRSLPWNCPVCAKQGHALDARHCKYCGAQLDVPKDVRERAIANV